MVSGVTVMMVSLSAIIVLIAVFAWIYMRGFTKGMQQDALGWLEAFEAIQVPNWQSLPVDYGEHSAEQIETNKLYVQAFKAAKDVIGEELIAYRTKTLLKRSS